MKNVIKVRPVLQMEKTECGAASLAMILEYYGKSVTLENMRRDCGVSRNGVNAKNIVKAARFHKLSARAVKSDIDGLKSLKMPLILHWNMNHFLVLCGFNRKGAVVADPAYGIRTVTADEFSSSFTGIAIEFTPDKDFETSTVSKKRVDYIAECVKPFLPRAVFFAVVALCAVTAGAAVLFLNSVFIDKILIGKNTQNLKTLLGVLICSGLITAASAALSEGACCRISQRLNIRINSGFIRRLLQLPIDFFAQRGEGDLTNRFNASMLMGERIVKLLAPIVGYVLQIASYAVLMAVFDVDIAVVGIISAAVNITVMLVSAGKYGTLSAAYSRDMGALQSRVSGTVAAIETIKASGAEDGAFENLSAAGTRALNTKTEINKSDMYAVNLFSFLNALSAAVILLCGIRKILTGQMTAGILISLQALASSMLRPVGEAVDSVIASLGLRGETARTDDVMRYASDDTFLGEADGQCADIDGDIELKNVVFGYSTVDEPFINGLNLKIKKGSRVAVTGKSGSGKSTLANLIAGLYRETGGSITFNGVERKDISRVHFYSRVSMVSQNTHLFDGSVLENITMWDESIPYGDVVAAAKTACMHDDIISRKNGYRERVTESGANFSGGQRQRIELARALVRKPSVIIMDEATSALDADTEEKVMNNIRALGITVIIIAHRSSATVGCDEIITMNGGKIIGHEKLKERENV